MTSGSVRSASIVYRGTVEAVSGVDIALSIVPASDGEEPITKDALGHTLVNVPGAANAEDVGETLRAFGALIGIKGAVRVTIEATDEH